MEKRNKSSAAFVTTNSSKSKRFIYNSFLDIIRLIKHKVSGCKNSIIKNKQRLQLWLTKVDLNLIKKEFGEWIVDTTIQGLLFNYTVHFLFGFEFNVFTIFAYGFAWKQSIAFIQSIKQHGTNK